MSTYARSLRLVPTKFLFTFLCSMKQNGNGNMYNGNGKGVEAVRAYTKGVEACTKAVEACIMPV